MTKSKAFDGDVDVELYLVGVILVVARSDAQCDTLHNIDEFGTNIFKSNSSELFSFSPSAVRVNYDAKATNQGFETILQNGIPSENYLKGYSPLNKNGDKDSEGYRVDWSNRADIYINCSYMNSVSN
uniref:Uncharacterized protein n=1 Tax=Glossina palpalis gambiensis TaxID=67801 RepID=A0A1B0BVL5_9MUSC